MIKKTKVWLCIVILFLFTLNNIVAQDPPPDDGDGKYLDEVPIVGELYFMIAALGVGGFILLRKQKVSKNI